MFKAFKTNDECVVQTNQYFHDLVQKKKRLKALK